MLHGAGFRINEHGGWMFLHEPTLQTNHTKYHNESWTASKKLPARLLTAETETKEWCQGRREKETERGGGRNQYAINDQ